MSSMFTRRQFLATAMAVPAISTRGRAFRMSGPVRSVAPSVTAADLLPPPIHTDTLHTLAAAAIDAARSAGATYADVRIADLPSVYIGHYVDFAPPYFSINSQFGFGIRVIVDGSMAFAYGDRPTIDAITTAARNAVASARGLAGRLRAPLELAPTPVIVGDWQAPMQIDPFTVPLQEQTDVLGGYEAIATRVKHGSLDPGKSGGFFWEHETRVFASSDGAQLTQRFRRATLSLGVFGIVGTRSVALVVDNAGSKSGGFELAIDPTWHDQIFRLTQDAVRLASLPITTVDVGRYDVVLTGAATATLVGQTIGPALELDRVIGDEAGASGTSYLAPPLAMLGQPVVSPLLSITNDRAGSSSTLARWDDDGCVCTSTPLIAQGHLVDYLTSRATAATLRPWYERTGKAVHANGNSIAPQASDEPLPRPGHLRVAPVSASISVAPSSSVRSSGATLDDLYRTVTRGILVQRIGEVVTDQQLASGMITDPMLLLEIQGGRVVRRVVGNLLQFSTQRLWTRSLQQLGDESTMAEVSVSTQKSQPTQRARSTVSAPAAHFVDIDVTR